MGGDEDVAVTQEFTSWSVEEAPENGPWDKFDYTVENESGAGVLWCTERQLRELQEEIEEALEK